MPRSNSPDANCVQTAASVIMMTFDLHLLEMDPPWYSATTKKHHSENHEIYMAQYMISYFPYDCTNKQIYASISYPGKARLR